MLDKLSFEAHRSVIVFASKLLVLMAVAMVVSGAMPTLSEAAPPTPSFVINVPTQVKVKEPIVIDVTLRNAVDVAGYEMTWLYDTSAADVNRLRQRNNAIRSLGRDINPLGPVDRSDGVSIGLSSCAFADCVSHGAGAARQRRGANGTVKLADFGLTPKKAGVLEVKLTGVKFVTADGTPISVDIPTQSFTVQVGAPGEGPRFPAPTPRSQPGPQPAAGQPGPFDLTGDRLVTYADSMQASIDWTTLRSKGITCGTEVPARDDVNHDGCLDIADLQLITQNYTDQDVRTASAAANSTETNNQTDATTAALTFVVNSVVDEDDANIGDGVCRTAGGVCSLRAAIEEANAHTGPDTINFNIPGSGVRTIQLVTTLPYLNDMSGGTTIDGYSQPGSAPNTHATVSNAVIQIEVKGQGPSAFSLMVINSANNVIRGLAMYNGYDKIWIYGSGAANNSVMGCFIGTDAAGNFGATGPYRTADGILIQTGSANNRIGSPAAADRNVISGNEFTGIDFKNEQSNGTLIYNNIIGLGPRGDKGLKNWGHGVDINVGASNNTVGGTAAGQRNVISANDISGVEVSHDTTTQNNQIVGNYIGTDVTGTQGPSWASMGTEHAVRAEDGVQGTIVSDNVLGNTPYEIVHIDGVSTTNTQVFNNRIGVSLNGTPLPQGGGGAVWIGWPASGNRIGPNNIIANSPADGILISNNENIQNTITQNSIYNNGQMGIELLWMQGVNPIGSGGPGSMANEGVDYPQLTSATPTQVTGTACANCRVELFLAQRQMTDLSNGTHGQGKTFVGAGTVGADGHFTISISGATLGDWLTATTTDGRGNTSEFSENIQVATGPTTTFRVNAGGSAYTDPSGKTWSEDTGFSGGGTFSTSASIANTTQGLLYQSERYGAVNYNWTVPNGTYQVALKFAEIYFTQAGQRVFNVAINGQTVLSNFDILSQTAPNTALDKTFTVNVTNGAITVAFTAVVSNPKVSAIEIVPITSTLRVNSGGDPYMDASGQPWSADTGFNGGGTYSNASASIAGTSDPTLYRSERYGNFNYTWTVPNGTYQVTLKFAEIWFTGSSGQRVFNVAINGQTVLSNFDILAQVPANTALDKSFPVTVTNGTLTIVFTSVVSNPKVSAIQIVPTP